MRYAEEIGNEIGDLTRQLGCEAIPALRLYPEEAALALAYEEGRATYRPSDTFRMLPLLYLLASELNNRPRF